MLKKISLLSLLLTFGIARSDDTSAADVRARSGAVAASALVKAAEHRDAVGMPGQRPWNNTPTQDRARIAGCLRIMGAGAAAIAGVAFMEYLRMQSVCYSDSL